VNILFLLVLLAAVAGGFVLLVRAMGWQAIENWRERIFGEVSTWLQMGGVVSTVIGSLPIDPVTSLGLWNMMPHELRAILPAGVLNIVGIVLFVLAWLSKYIKQPKLRAKIEAKQP